MGKKKASTSEVPPPAAANKREELEEEELELFEAAATAAAGAGAAKKKRKRRKKKGANAAGGGGGEGGEEASEDEEGDEEEGKGPKEAAASSDLDSARLGPMAHLVKEYEKKGYAPALTLEVVNVMFDKGYDYHKEALMLHLLDWAMKNGTGTIEDGYRSFSGSPTPLHSDQRPAGPAAAAADTGGEQQQQLPAEKKGGKEAKAPAPTAAPAPAAPQPKPKQQQQQQQKAGQQQQAEQRPAPAASVPAATAPAAAAQASAGMTLEAKLEAAAGNADVAEALRMLAASAVREEDAPALRPALLASRAFEVAAEGLLRVALEEHPLPNYGAEEGASPLPSALAEELGDLVQTLLDGRKGAAAASETALAVLAQARALEAQARAQGRTLSGPARSRLGETLGGALKACFAARKSPASAKAAVKELEALEGRLRQLGAAGVPARLPAASAGLRELLEQRERHAGSAELHAACCRVLVQQATGQALASVDAEQEGRVRARQAEAARGLLVEAVVEDLVGLSPGQLQAKKREMEGVRQQLAVEGGRLEAELRPLAEEAARRKAEATALQEEKAALERQLAEVEARLGAAQSGAAAAEAAMGKRRAAMEAALAERDRGLQDGLRLLRAAEAAEELGARVEALGAALLQAPAAEGADAADAKKLRQRVRAFGVVLEPYLQVQARLYEALAARKDGLELERAKLLDQAAQFGGIGLQENKRDLEARAAEAAAYAAEDRGAMAQLATDAEGLYRSFRAAIEAAGGVGGEWMARGEGADVSAVLGGVKQALDRLGLAQDWLPGLAPAKRPTTPAHAPSPVPPAAPIQPPPPPPPPQQQQQQQQQQPPNGLAAPVSTPAPLVVPSPGPALLGGTPVMAAARTPVQQQQHRPPRTPGAIQQPGAVGSGQQQAPSPPIKFSWASRVATSSAAAAAAAAAPGGGAATAGTGGGVFSQQGPGQGQKSLVQIIEEERQSQLTEENLRRLEQGKATGSAAAARLRGGIGSSEAEVNSMTDRTLGAATVSSEGGAELGGAGGVVTAVGAIPPQALGAQVGGEEPATGAPLGLATAAATGVNGL